VNKKNNLVWIDLEMTGLDAQKDGIIEIALVITDNQLTILHEGPSLIIHQPDALLATMDTWVKNQHTKSGLVAAVQQSTITIEQAQQAVLDVIVQYCEPNTGVLCGNTIWQDRVFLMRYMPKISAYLHYRMIDVSTIKELVTRWFPGNTAAKFKKKDAHRALTDIVESIAELEHYRKNFFIV
jgi:oligoribonuclease